MTEGGGGSERSSVIRYVYSPSTWTGKVMEPGKTDCRLEHWHKHTDTNRRTEAHTQKKTRALFSNLARADKTSAFRDLSGASVQVHYLDGWAWSQSFTDSVQYMCLSVCLCVCAWFLALVCTFAHLFVNVHVCVLVCVWPLCPETHRKAETHLVEDWQILADISSLWQINK